MSYFVSTNNIAMGSIVFLCGYFHENYFLSRPTMSPFAMLLFCVIL